MSFCSRFKLKNIENMRITYVFPIHVRLTRELSALVPRYSSRFPIAHRDKCIWFALFHNHVLCAIVFLWQCLMQSVAMAFRMLATDGEENKMILNLIGFFKLITTNRI